MCHSIGGISLVNFAMCSVTQQRCCTELSHNSLLTYRPQEPKIQMSLLAFFEADKARKISLFISFLVELGMTLSKYQGLPADFFFLVLQTGKVKIGDSFLSPWSTSFFWSSRTLLGGTGWLFKDSDHPSRMAADQQWADWDKGSREGWCGSQANGLVWCFLTFLP